MPCVIWLLEPTLGYLKLLQATSGYFRVPKGSVGHEKNEASSTAGPRHPYYVKCYPEVKAPQTYRFLLFFLRLFGSCKAQKSPSPTRHTHQSRLASHNGWSKGTPAICLRRFLHIMFSCITHHHTKPCISTKTHIYDVPVASPRRPLWFPIFLSSKSRGDAVYAVDNYNIIKV